MQNLRRAGKNSGPILSRLWTKVHDIYAVVTYEIKLFQNYLCLRRRPCEIKWLQVKWSTEIISKLFQNNFISRVTMLLETI